MTYFIAQANFKTCVYRDDLYRRVEADPGGGAAGDGGRGGAGRRAAPGAHQQGRHGQRRQP